MSDFPKGGGVEVTRKWLDKEGFPDVFKGIWKADALLGKEDIFIKSKFPSTDEGQERAEVLCGLLNTARQLKEGGSTEVACRVPDISIKNLIENGNEGKNQVCLKKKFLPFEGKCLDAIVLPTMVSYGHTHTEVKGGMNSIDFEERSFNICPLPAIDGNEPSSLLVKGTYGGKAITIDYNGESSVEQIIVLLLEDILKGLGLNSKFKVHTQMVPDADERADVYVVTAFGIILLLVKVKRPSIYKSSVHAQCLGQAYDYLRRNRIYYSHGYSFGVWMTYEQMRFIWLDDAMHNNLAASSAVDTEVKYPLPAYDYEWDARRASVSKIYSKADNIPKILACLIYKLLNSEVVVKSVLNKMYCSPKLRTAAREGYFYQVCNNICNKLRFDLCQSNNETFHLLQQHKGRDGKVFVSVSRNGNLCIVKFRHANKVVDMKWKDISKDETAYAPIEEADTTKALAEDENNGGNSGLIEEGVDMVDTEELAAQLHLTLSIRAQEPQSDRVAEHEIDMHTEQDLWVTVYKTRAHRRELARRPAVILPFAFCYNHNGVMGSSLNDFIPCDKDVTAIHWETIQQLLSAANRVEVLFKALETVATFKLVHDDIKWCHVALLPVYKSGEVSMLRPILIDMSFMLLVESKKAALKSMCDAVLVANMLSEPSEREQFEVLMNKALVTS